MGLSGLTFDYTHVVLTALLLVCVSIANRQKEQSELLARKLDYISSNCIYSAPAQQYVEGAEYDLYEGSPLRRRGRSTGR